jgi:hypothetical protein
MDRIARCQVVRTADVAGLVCPLKSTKTSFVQPGGGWNSAQKETIGPQIHIVAAGSETALYQSQMGLCRPVRNHKSRKTAVFTI